MRRESFDLAVCPLDHHLEVGDELPVYWIVRRVKCVKGGGAGSEEDPKRGEFFRSIRLDKPTRARRAVASNRVVTPTRAPTASGLAFGRREGRRT